MQARRNHHRKTISLTRTARPKAVRQRTLRLTALLCGLLLCLGTAMVLRACAQRAAPAGCSLQGRTPSSDFTFPLGTSSWRLSSGYGWRPDPLDPEQEDFHRGVDLACGEGTPVLAAMDGVVFAAGHSASYGNYIRLTHDDGMETLYAHLQYLYARPGQVVQAGEILGTAGQTGRATGPHLHFELMCRATRYDPSDLLGLGEAA